MICPYCGGHITQVEPLDENLDAHGRPIREFECQECGEVMDEDQLDDEDDEVIEDSWSEETDDLEETEEEAQAVGQELEDDDEEEDV